MNSLDYYSGRLIGKLTAFLQLQEFSLCNIPVEESSISAFLSQLKSKIGSSLAKAAAIRVNLNIDGAPITSRLSHHARILTHLTHRRLAC